jgi:RNA polymerase sigma-70 factor (ECF subfamily)
MNANEMTLLRRAQHGDRAAGDELFKAHLQMVTRVAQKMCNGRGDFEAALQEALFHAWEALPRFKGECEIGTWLYRIVANSCLKEIASQRRQESQQLPVNAPAINPNPEELLLLDEKADVVGQYLSILGRALDNSSKSIRIFKAREIDGKTWKNISAEFECSVSACRVHHFRALIRLRTKLKVDKPVVSVPEVSR